MVVRRCDGRFWKIENRKWKLENGNWKMECHKILILEHSNQLYYICLHRSNHFLTRLNVNSATGLLFCNMVNTYESVDFISILYFRRALPGLEIS